MQAYSLSEIQKGILFGSCFNPEKTYIYLNQAIIEFTEVIDIDKLQNAIRRVHINYPVLNAFIEPAQLKLTINNEFQPELKVTRIDPSVSNNDNNLIEHYKESELAKGIDIKTPPLIRFHLIILSEKKQVLLITYHHILMAGRSVMEVLQDLMAMYDGINNHRHEMTTPRAILNKRINQITEHIDLSNIKNYYQTQLDGIQENPPIGTRCNASGKIPKHFIGSLTPTLSNTIKLYCKEQHITLPIFLQLSWALLQHWYQSSDFCLFGMTKELPNKDVKGTCGFAINTIPVMLRFNDKLSIYQLISTLRTQAKLSKKSVYYPLKNIRQFTHIPNDEAIFNTIIDFKPRSVNDIMKQTNPYWESRSRHITVEFYTDYPLFIEFYHENHQLTSKITYHNEYHQQMISNVFSLLENIMSLVVGTDINTRISEIYKVIAATKEKQFFIVGPEHAHPGKATLSDKLTTVCSQFNSKPAIIYDKLMLSYQELNDLVCQIEQLFKNTYQIASGHIIYISATRHILYIPLVLTCIKLNVTFVPFSPEVKTEKERLMKLVNPNLIVNLTPSTEQSIDTLLSELKQSTTMRHLAMNSEVIDDMAYILFTSGTTGKPKGVKITINALENLLIAFQNQLHLNQNDIFLSISDFTFDIAYLELLLPILSGATCLIATPAQKLQPLLLKQLINDNQVSILQGTPSFLAAYLRAETFPTCLKQVICGGEALTKSLASKLMKSSITLWNAYGPTETTIWSTFNKVKSLNVETDIISLGKPIDNTTIGILGAKNKWLPSNAIGEICISGAGLFSGYLNNDEKTQQSIAHYQHDNQLVTFYKTGDRGYIDHEGKLHFIERLDDQLKIQGHRVELTHIEQTLETIDGINKAIICVFNHDKTPHLIAYYTATKLLDDKFITAEAKQLLPYYMQPFCYVRVDAFPMTHSGKVDKSKLEKPDLMRQAVEITNPDAEFLKYHWASTLNIDKENINMQSHFFMLGGNSIDALKIINGVNEFYSTNLIIKDLFEYPVFNEFYRQIKAHQQHRQKHPFTIKQIEKKQCEAYPLSFQQERLWSFYKLNKKSSMYNMFVSFELNGKLQDSLLEKAIHYLIKRHSILRTTYSLRDGRPVQIVHDPYNLPMTMFTYESQIEDVERYAKEFSNYLFNLDTEFPIKSALLSLNTDKHYFFINLHHIACDGWSIAILLNDLNEYLLSQASNDSASQIKLSTFRRIEYKDYAYWQRKSQENNIVENEQKKFWKHYLSDTQPILLPHRHTSTLNRKGARVSFTLKEDLLVKIKAFANQNNTTSFLVLVSAFAALLYRYTLQNDFFITVPVSGRQHPQLEDIVGFFVNLLPLKFKVEEKTTLTELCELSKNHLFNIIKNQDIPFNLIRQQFEQTLKTKSVLEHDPMLNVLFVMQETLANTLEIPFVSTSRSFSDNKTLLLSDFDSSKFNMTMFLQEESHGIQGLLEYNQSLYSHEFIEGIINNYQLFLFALITQMDQPIQSLSFKNAPIVTTHSPTTSQDKKSLLTQWQAIASRESNNIAIHSETRTFTYEQVESLSNQMSHQIIANLQSKTPIIALHFSDQINFIIASLATLKANCAYLPLDSSAPMKRINTILADANPSLVITDSRELSTNSQMNTWVVDKLVDQPGEKTSVLKDKPLELAYVIYTSGTTSTPKGVCVNHSNLTALLKSTKPLFDFNQHDKWCLLHSTAFDFSVWEIWGAFFHGAQLCIPEKGVNYHPKMLLAFLIKHEITILNLTPGLFELLINELRNNHDLCTSLAKCLRHIILGGDSIESIDIHEWFNLPISNTVQLYNLYGITEATVHTTCHKLTKANFNSANHNNIGQALPHLNVHVIDQQHQIVPNHIIGELAISGDGVSQGYLSTQNSASFFQVENDGKIIRLFKTGDLVRRWENNDLEYIGRRDAQIKLRGFRIGLNEIIEAAKQHEAVDHAFVFVKSINNHPQLHLYLIVNKQYLHRDSETIKQWKKVYDKFYEQKNDVDALNTIGWLSSYTESQYPLSTMKEWLKLTLQRIHVTQGQNILEVGCGSGMLMFDNLTKVSTYTATDISTVSLQQLADRLTDHEKEKVIFLNQAAHEIKHLEPAHYHLLICNSVIQYFPSGDYLLKCLHQWLPLMKPNSTLFLGDIRSLAHQQQFYQKVAYKRGIDVHAAKTFVERQTLSEEELLVHHDFFKHLPQLFKQINYVKIELKYGGFESEMSDFRYDVTLGIEKPEPSKIVDIIWEDYGNLDIDNALEKLSSSHNSYLAIKNIKNKAFTNLYDQVNDDISINDLARKAAHYDLNVFVQFSKEKPKTCFDIIFFHPEILHTIESLCFPRLIEEKLNDKQERYFNNPETINNPYLFKEIMTHLRNQLPAYMLPNKTFYLEQLPLTNNGKINYDEMFHQGKPILQQQGIGQHSQLTPTEEKVAILWSTVLNTPFTNKNMDFFQVGGNSLQAIQMISEAEKRFNIVIPIKLFYTHSNLTKFSKMIDELMMSTELSNLGIYYEKVENTPFVTLKNGREIPPLFLFHPIGGSVFPYLDLVNHLTTEQTVYAAQDPAIDNHFVMAKSISKLVTYYLRYIYKIQSVGPYFFAGSSLGGTLAYEAAYQIKQQKPEEKVFVAMFDSWALYTEKLADKKRLEEGLMRQYQLIKDKLASISLKDPTTWLNLHYERLKQVAEYKPPRCDQEIILYKAKTLRSEFLEIDDPTNHWKSYTKGAIKTVYVPGDHETIMLNENVKHIALSLNDKLNPLLS